MNRVLKLISFFVLLAATMTIIAEDTMSKQPKNVSYTRLYTDDAGDSHFENGEIPLELASYAQPEPKVGLSPTQAAASITFFSAPPGYFADWHTAVKKQYLFHLSGTTEIVVSDGESRIFKTGDIILVEDTTGKGHTARVVGDEDVVIAAVPVLMNKELSSHQEAKAD